MKSLSSCGLVLALALATPVAAQPCGDWSQPATIEPLVTLDAPGTVTYSGRFRAFHEVHHDVDGDWTGVEIYDLGQWADPGPIYEDVIANYEDSGTARVTAADAGRILVSRLADLQMLGTVVVDLATGEIGPIPGEVPEPGGVFQGDLLWGAGWGSHELTAWDVSDLQAIHQVGSWPIAGAADYALRGDVLVLLDEGMVRTVDIADPSAPVLLDQLAVTDWLAPDQVAALCGELLLRTDGDELEIVDLSDPAALRLRGTATPLAGDWPVITASGDLVAVGGLTGLRILSIADPDLPVVLAAPLDSAQQGLAMDGELLYVALGLGVRLYDLADPAAPATIGTVLGPRGPATLIHGQTLVTGLAAYPLHCGGSVGAPMPDARVVLAAPAPNPFNPLTTVRVSLPRDGAARLTVHDLRGRCVRRLVDGYLAAGERELAWDGRDDAGRELASGTYLVRLVTGAEVRTTKAVLVR